MMMSRWNYVNWSLVTCQMTLAGNRNWCLWYTNLTCCFSLLPRNFHWFSWRCPCICLLYVPIVCQAIFTVLCYETAGEAMSEVHTASKGLKECCLPHLNSPRRIYQLLCRLQTELLLKHFTLEANIYFLAHNSQWVHQVHVSSGCRYTSHFQTSPQNHTFWQTQTM